MPTGGGPAEAATLLLLAAPGCEPSNPNLSQVSGPPAGVDPANLPHSFPIPDHPMKARLLGYIVQ